ncbi:MULTISPECIES: cyanophycinase [unclassified Duganella]|jgi:cyanophycinase|uniref:cyanophycinase n=1 Tax=unclassified Duganella TaxID=2636909 RepID=UPI0008821940|nr:MULTISPECIES: cyanophycinase [unclassified Duganella]SDG43030.1 cyanophycinase [Duganella sp. OV458]SDJ60965.1 cyanophycinase [Duganella sp. OV510]
MIIGGNEDRTDNKEILTRFVELAGGLDQPIMVITAASTVPDDVWEMYRKAFDDLGATNVTHVRITAREQAEDDMLAHRMAEARGIFMTGGDQKRLMTFLGGTQLERAMRRAYCDHAACIAGTSAGASGLCTHMLAEGKAELAPEKGAVRLGAGLGFVSRVVIDQHFSQRHRLNRLLSVIAQSPFLLGAGIDEDTALIVQEGAIEVIGEGTVTVADCRNARTNITEVRAGVVPELLDVRLHLLPSGSSFNHADDKGPLADFIQYLTDRTLEHEHR